MCDYSLGGLPNRLAVEGEELTVYRFRTGSMGLASSADLRSKTLAAKHDKRPWQQIKDFFALKPNCPDATAVCVPPGARLILKNIPVGLQRILTIGEEESVLFLQTDVEVNTYRDALRFHNGREVLLQHLREGISAEVTSLSGDLTGEPESALNSSSRSAHKIPQWDL